MDAPVKTAKYPRTRPRPQLRYGCTRGRFFLGGEYLNFDHIFLSYGDDWITLILVIVSCIFSYLAQRRAKKLSTTNTQEEKGSEQTTAETPEVNAATAVALSAAAKEVTDEMKFSEGYDVSIDVNVSGGAAVVTANCYDKKTGVSVQGTECAAKLRELADAISPKKEA